jgi:protein-disulfide isomerase
MSKRFDSKREEMRSRRLQAQKKQQIIWIGVMILGALIVAAVLILPSLKPVGEINVPALNPRPLAQNSAMGDPNAPVKIEEYADFQCPACDNWSKTVEPGFISKYIVTGKVYFTYHPFSFIDDNGPGRESKAAAEAAYCAMDQGKFWEFHDIIYANQTGENVGNFSDRRLLAFADKLSLDAAAFKSCFQSGKYKAKVLEEKSQGENLGVNSTPSFAINGKLVTLKQYSDLDKAIDQALQGK